MAIYCPRIMQDHGRRCVGEYHEDERFVEFGSEKPSSRSTGNVGVVIFRDYGGEDFSRYLRDDDDEGVGPATGSHPFERNAKSSGESAKKQSAAESRYRRRGSRSGEVEDITIPTGPFQMETTTTSISGGPGGRKSADGLKERLAQLIPRPSRRPRSTSRQCSKMQDYSFTDLKAGSFLLVTQQQQQRNGSTTSSHDTDDAASDARSSGLVETRSDLGYPDRKSSWWNLDTLSDRNGIGADQTQAAKSRSAKTRGLRRKTKSVPDLLDAEPANGFDRTHQDDKQNQEKPITGPVSCWDDGVRSGTDRMNGQNAPQRSLWKKVTRTFRGSGREDTRLRTHSGQYSAQGKETQEPVKALAKKRSLPLTPPTTDTSLNSVDIYDEIML